MTKRSTTPDLVSKSPMQQEAYNYSDESNDIRITAQDVDPVPFNVKSKTKSATTSLKSDLEMDDEQSSNVNSERIDLNDSQQHE